MAYRIAVVGGDGIGPEVTAEALKARPQLGVLKIFKPNFWAAVTVA